MNGVLRSLWEGLVRFGAPHNGALPYEEPQVLVALGQVGCLLDGGTARRVRPPEGLSPEGPAPAGPGDGGLGG